MLYKHYFKRSLDIFISLFSIFLLSPIFFLIFIVLSFERGPIIFSQQRVGLNGKIFVMYKFRTLPHNIGDIPSALLGHVNKTLLGKILRRTNLDEIPQLFNILLGDMSLVGPRPALIIQEQLILSRKLNGALTVRPGLTGLAQIKAFNSMTDHKKAEYDAKYVSDISFFLDIYIIFLTAIYLFKPQPIY